MCVKSKWVENGVDVYSLESLPKEKHNEDIWKGFSQGPADRFLYSCSLSKGGAHVCANMYLTDKTIETFKRNGCFLIKNQWVDYNEIVKYLPSPLKAMSIHITDEFRLVGELIRVSEQFVSGNGMTTIVSPVYTTEGDDFQHVYRDLLKKAKDIVIEYHRSIERSDMWDAK